MIFKRIGSAAILLLILAFPVSASMVSFLVVETGLEGGNVGSQYSSLWEGGLMAAFFDAGHIVTNYPVIQMKNRPENDISGVIENEFNEAASGGSDYFILGFLEYKNLGGVITPVGMTLKLYSTSPKELLYEQIFPAGKGKSLNEEYQFAQNAGFVLASNIKEW